jgi:hypothetical protein
MIHGNHPEINENFGCHCEERSDMTNPAYVIARHCIAQRSNPKQSLGFFPTCPRNCHVASLLTMISRGTLCLCAFVPLWQIFLGSDLLGLGIASHTFGIARNDRKCRISTHSFGMLAMTNQVPSPRYPVSPYPLFPDTPLPRFIMGFEMKSETYLQRRSLI